MAKDRLKTIESASLRIGNQDYPLSLSDSALLIIDVLARHKPRLLTARQIERILATDASIRMAANAWSGTQMSHRLARGSIKVYVMRLRRRLQEALKKAGVTVCANDVLVSEQTELSNIVAYRLAIPCEFTYCLGDRNLNFFDRTIYRCWT